MIDVHKKPLSETSIAPIEIFHVEKNQQQQVVLDLSHDSSIFAQVSDGASLTVIAVGEINASVSLVRSAELGLGASIHFLLACRILSQGKLQCDDNVHLVQNSAECILDDRCVIEEGGEGIVRQCVYVSKETSGCMVQSNIRGMLFGSAKMNAIPELHIATSRVRAKHSVTIARPSPMVLAYFATRGVKEEDAQRVFADQFLCPISVLI